MTDTAEHFDVLIVGAGLSGIGAGYHLQEKCPGKSYVILEGRDCIGGTWDLFRYPGIRSDSDMHTLGYSFKPWLDAKAIADGPAILDYVRQTAAENDVDVLEFDLRGDARQRDGKVRRCDQRLEVLPDRAAVGGEPVEGDGARGIVEGLEQRKPLDVIEVVVREEDVVARRPPPALLRESRPQDPRTRPTVENEDFVVGNADGRTGRVPAVAELVRLGSRDGPANAPKFQPVLVRWHRPAAPFANGGF
jgi:hypothetical protein